MSKDDATAAFYSEPANREPVGSPVRRRTSKRPLTRHVPIRFEALTISRAKYFADRDGATVSAWIRRLVEREVERRMSNTETLPSAPKAQLTPLGSAELTRSDSEPHVEVLAS